MKGVDRVRGEMVDKFDVLMNHVVYRFLTASDSFRRIFSFLLHGESHTFMLLQVHLADQQQVFFREGDPQGAFTAIKNIKAVREPRVTQT